MFENLNLKIIIKINRMKYKNYYNKLEKSNKYIIINTKKDYI